MKRNIILFSLILALLLSMAGCSASSKTAAYDTAAPAAPYADYAPMEEAEVYNYASDDYVSYDAPEFEAKSEESGSGFSADVPDYAEKMIYTAEANVQTLTFDDSVELIQQLVKQCGGFVESSSVTGKDFYATTRKYRSYRNASFTLRIPTTQFSGFQDTLSEVGNVTYLNATAQNITTAYYDTEGRLSAFRVEEERLLAMLEKCETVEDMIAIESRLSEVRYHIESLTSTLKRYDQQVAYSTLIVYLDEVVELTEEEPIQRTYWQQIGDGFVDSLKGVGWFFADMFRFLLSASPYLILIAIALFVIILLIRRGSKRRAQRKLEKQQKKLALQQELAARHKEQKEE